MTIENWIQLLVPIISIFIAIVSASLSYFFAKKQQIIADERKLKEQHYLDYIGAVSELVIQDNTESNMDKLADAQNKLLLVGSSDVVQDLMAFHNYVISCNNSGKEVDTEKHDKILTSLLKNMRQDLYKHKKINQNYPTIHLSGKTVKQKQKETTNNPIVCV